MDAGELRRRRRDELNMTQAELAKALGWTQQAVARLESGKRRITHPVVLALALEALQVRRSGSGRASALEVHSFGVDPEPADGDDSL